MKPETLKKLKAFFPVDAHKERPLPGGGRWFYLPWQAIRERLDEVCPDWSCTYSDPVIAGDFVTIRCKIAIEGVIREAVGNDKSYPELNENGKPKTIGTPIERAAADAFKNAAEQFGVGAYLDDQKDNQKAVVKYFASKGSQKATKMYEENNGPIARNNYQPKPSPNIVR